MWKTLKVKKVFREVRDYGRYFLKRSPLPSKKFVIFGRGRSGSTLLVNLLNSHKQIHCDNEILHNPVWFPRLHIDVCASQCRSSVYGFKLLSYQIRDVQHISNPEQFLQDLYENGYKIIYLVRRNLLYHALSNLKARQNKFHHRLSDGELKKKSVYVPVEEVLNWIASSEALRDYELRILQNIPHLKLTYEDNLLNSSTHQATAERIFEMFNLSSVQVQTNLVKLLQPHLADMVENHEQLTKALQKTTYAHFLESN